MGLVQQVVERAGITTVGVTIVRKYTEAVGPPRSVFLRWPYGHPMGEPGNIAQQRAVLALALQAICDITEPGTIIDLPLRWRLDDYVKYAGFRPGC